MMAHKNNSVFQNHLNICRTASNNDKYLTPVVLKFAYLLEAGAYPVHTTDINNAIQFVCHTLVNVTTITTRCNNNVN